ncbi:eukaryotic translation initiation factor 4E-binding protein Mextli [Galendromus occidentalis]|uniref:Eukaryotic translation initiation factor 4E-binding protein Mextli n=1 Tax=Galendromus occidentalis TaxID=34638 RepID=A0AAJ7WJ94_9ACAR|nr:eukaryotic translation initiation factor 4E-binding protein Mextli [Galendromus occidentalis]
MSLAAPLQVSKSSSSVKCVQKLSKPRPLKLGSSGESENIPPLVSPVALTYANVESINEDDVLRELENLHVNISNGNFETTTTALVTRVCQLLKLRGAHIDASHKDQLDVYMVTLRSAARDDRLDATCRTELLEILELRCLKWRPTDDVAEYYKKLEPETCSVSSIAQNQSVSQVGVMGPPLFQQPLVQANGPATMIIPQYIPLTQFPLGPTMQSVQPNVLANVPLQQVQAVQPPFMPGEVLRSSGKYGKPSKVPGRNFLKDEVVIRNADSGKVMGIKGRRVHMIEELSETVISFQRVSPGARDRLVQITGPTEESISQAKQLIEETIRRNASPVREQSSQDDSSGGSYENSVATSPSQGAPLSPQESAPKPPPLQHSLSTSDATADRDYTFVVQGIKISAPKQQLALAAKAVLEQHFNASSMMQGVTDPNFMRVSPQGASLLHSLSGHFYNQQRIQDIWSATSSSDEDTYRRDDPRRSSDSPDRENEFYQQPSIVFSRDQLLDLASSEFTKKAPQDLDDLDSDFAVVIMRQDLTTFDVEAFRKWSPSRSTGVQQSSNTHRTSPGRSPSNESEDTP